MSPFYSWASWLTLTFGNITGGAKGRDHQRHQTRFLAPVHGPCEVLCINQNSFVVGTKRSGLEGFRIFASISSEYCFFLRGTWLLPGMNRIKWSHANWPRTPDSRASLVAQMVKNLPAMQETQVQSLGQEDTWRREWPYFSILAWRLSMDWGVQQGTVYGITKESDTTKRLTFELSFPICKIPLDLVKHWVKPLHQFRAQ